jgi:hypothetical protein
MSRKRAIDEQEEEEDDTASPPIVVHSANKWEEANLGDDQRKAKFLRLMGGAKVLLYTVSRYILYRKIIPVDLFAVMMMIVAIHEKVGVNLVCCSHFGYSRLIFVIIIFCG